MAETLGSLVDKLTIKEIREFHICQMLELKDRKFTETELKGKLEILRAQKKALAKEIDVFLSLACKGIIRLKDEKLKLYNEKKQIGRISNADTLGDAISGLASKNLELWHLEDEARRKDVALSYIGEIKRKIDAANQQRNDFIDRIDELLEQMTGKKTRKGKRA